MATVPSQAAENNTPPSPGNEKRRSRWKRGCLVTGFVLLAIGGYPAYVLVAEHVRLSGTWQVLNPDGTEQYRGGELNTLHLTFPLFWVNPFANPRQINFRRELGGGFGWQTYRGIYQWEGDKMRFAEASEGARRPTTYDPEQMPILEPGARSGYAGVGVLKRLDKN